MGDRAQGRKYWKKAWKSTDRPAKLQQVKLEEKEED